MGTKSTRMVIAIGKNLFHVKYIRLSYRIRGMVARIQINKIDRDRVSKIKMILFNDLIPVIPIITQEVIKLIARILVYSAIKISANNPLLYSTLNPDTSSDSPSAKSKGVRLVSAKFVINHRTATSGMASKTEVY